jgi:hypothetical protein
MPKHNPVMEVNILNIRKSLNKAYLKVKKSDPAADTSVLEAEIDRLVYELYGLTDEEIRIVESAK